MIRIGPSGNSASFYESGLKHTYQAPAWLSEQGLNAFEYSFGRGISMGDETAKKIAEQMRLYDIQISCHAPYYINLANPDDNEAAKSFLYITQSLNALKLLGGNRCVVHTGTVKGNQRSTSIALVNKRLTELVKILDCDEYKDLYLCLETMGKFGQIGTVDEILEFCNFSDNFLPCFDFGHINSLTQGSLKTSDDFKRIVDKSFEKIGDYKTRNMHVHFSKIQYGASGEIRHLDFSDETYGPDFQPFAEVIAEYKLCPVLICESKERMSDDALQMKSILERYL